MAPRQVITALMQLTSPIRQPDFLDAIAMLQDKNFRAKLNEEKVQEIFNIKKYLSEMANDPGADGGDFFRAAREQGLFNNKGIVDLSQTNLPDLIKQAANARKKYSDPETKQEEAKKHFEEYRQHLQSIAALAGGSISAEELEKGINSIVDTDTINEERWVHDITNWLQCNIILDFIKKNSPPIVNIASNYDQLMSEIASYFRDKGTTLEGADHFVPVRIEIMARAAEHKSLGIIQSNLTLLEPCLTEKEMGKISQLKAAVNATIGVRSTASREEKKLNIHENVSSFLIDKQLKKQVILPIEKWILDLEKISKSMDKSDPQKQAIDILSSHLRKQIVEYEKSKNLDFTDIGTMLSMTKKALIANASSYGNTKVAAARFFSRLKSPTTLKYISNMEQQLNKMSQPEVKEENRATLSK